MALQLFRLALCFLLGLKLLKKHILADLALILDSLMLLLAKLLGDFIQILLQPAHLRPDDRGRGAGVRDVP